MPAMTATDELQEHLPGRLEDFRRLTRTVPASTTERLEELRAALRAESISYGELAELQGLAEWIADDDVELLEPAGVPEESLDERRDEREEELYNYPLSVENLRVVKILLSTGGPADWLEVLLDEENDARRIEYHFAPWFDHASVTLEGDDFDAADAFARALTGDYYLEQS